MLVNVYTHYDSNKTVIAKIRPHTKTVYRFDGSEDIFYISSRTYNRLLSLRTIGGCAGIYTDCGHEIYIERQGEIDFCHSIR